VGPRRAHLPALTGGAPRAGEAACRRLPLPAIVLGGLLLTGCLPGPVTLPGVGGDDYQNELSRWTRKEEVYRGFEAKIFVTATYHADSFRDAYTQKRAAVLGLSDRDQRQLRDDQRRTAESFHEFFVAVYTGERRWNDLEKPGSIWRLALVNDRSERVAPSEILRIDRRDAEVEAFYPFLDRFTQGYLIRFPKTSLELNAPLLDETVRSFRLQLSSPVAVAELSWSLPGG